MKTRAQSWAERLRELRARMRECGDRLDAELRDGYRRDHDGAWWAEFCAAAEAGEELPPAVWRSAAELVVGSSGRAGWLQRLKSRNAHARSSRPRVLPMKGVP